MAGTAEALHVLVTTDDDSDKRRLAMATANLARELTQARFAAALDQGSGDAPAGSKSATAVTIGSIAVSGVFSAAALRQLTRIVTAYIQRGSARKIKITDGDREIVIDGLSGKAQQALIDNWIESRDAPSGS
ncbi:hypothetical protein YIM_37265 [Amycolatopsis sp. YIM 10]|nr:hypothetical protein YIM_37265 [Amycolatopsis sp. YIM 10]